MKKSTTGGCTQNVGGSVGATNIVNKWALSQASIAELAALQPLM